jgi:hypothetical protein
MAVKFLKINFFPLKEQNFAIPIYRKLFKESENKNVFQFPVKKYSLPKKDLTETREQYWITFDEHEAFEKYEVSSLENRFLTLSYLFSMIETKVKNCHIPYQIGDKFMNVIDIIIDENKLGKESICVIPAYQNKKYGILLDFHFFKGREVPHSINVQKKTLSLDKSGKSNKNYYVDKYNKINGFIKTKFETIFMPLDKDGLIEFSNNMESIEAHKLETKKYICGGSNYSNSQFQGILNQGPYIKLEEETMLGFVYRNSEKSLSHELYYALRGERFATFKGMEKMFGVKIQKDTVIGHGVDDYNEQEVIKMIDAIIERSNGKKIVPIIIVPWDKTSADETQRKIYFLIKFSFLKHNIPCQFIDIDKIKKYDTFKWMISGIGLQIFTKLGGSPWCLVPGTEKCLIIGIGQTHRKNENNNIERYYAYSVQNDSSGLFRNIKLLSDNTDRNQYLNGLSNNLKEIILTQAEEFDCFVIHTTFKLRRDEMDTIRKVVEALSNETDKKFAVLRFNNDHYYMSYDFKNGNLIPYESTFVKISADNYLVWFEGLQYGDYSSARERIGPPVQISIDFHQEETQYTDILKYLQDAINLSGANWRGFNAKTIPVSILYARLLSGFISAFDKYKFDDINIENITPWFL